MIAAVTKVTVTHNIVASNNVRLNHIAKNLPSTIKNNVNIPDTNNAPQRIIKMVNNANTALRISSSFKKS